MSMLNDLNIRLCVLEDRLMEEVKRATTAEAVLHDVFQDKNQEPLLSIGREVWFSHGFVKNGSIIAVGNKKAAVWINEFAGGGRVNYVVFVDINELAFSKSEAMKKKNEG